MTDQEFILYLKEIQDDCVERYFCDGCKYYTKFGCVFKQIPADWQLCELPAYPEPAADPRQPLTPAVVEEFYEALEGRQKNV